MLKTLFTTAAISLMAASAFAAPAAHKSAKNAAKPTVKPATLVCPVTGEKIASVKDAAGHSTYKGKTYYFCCSSCKPAFDKDPSKYIKSAGATAKVKPGATHKM